MSMAPGQEASGHAAFAEPTGGTGAGQANGGLTDAGLRSSIIFDANTVVVGFLVWWLMSSCGVAYARSDRPDRRLSTVAENYLLFLEICRNMFLAQTAISALATIPWWGLAPITMGLNDGTLNTTAHLGSTGLAILCLDSAVRGLVALAFVERLRRRIRQPLLQGPERDAILRTLWLTGLPATDSATGEPFLFEDKDFERVSQDLREAINNDLNKRTLGTVKQAEMRVEVVPIVDEWHRVSCDLCTAQERLEAYRLLLNARKHGCWGALRAHHYARQHWRFQAEVARLQADLDRIATAKKGISGAAFVTFEHVKHRDHFLKERPKCWQCRNFAYFTFGRPPFASVTLNCMRAPHPSDVNWLNLHIPVWQQRLRGAILLTFLLVGMVTLVTPVTITSQLNVIVPKLQRRVEAVASWFHARHLLLGHSIQFWYSVTNQLPALVLVLINSLLLPDCICRISMAVRPHRHSHVEVIQLHLNYVFMVLNALVIPILGLTSIGAIMEWGQSRVGLPFKQIATNITQTLMQSSGIFAVRYIMNCACLSNVNSLLQLAQLFYRGYARKVARTARELVEAEQQWTFAWGYCYAWTISIFTIGVCMSTVAPGTLPGSAIFFTLQHFVDRHNLTRGVYAAGAESENLFVTRALHYMRCVVGLWWAMMGGTFTFLLQQGLMDNWESRVPLELVCGTAAALIVGGLGLAVWSWWDQQSILHDAHFQMVDVSKRGMHRHGFGVQLDEFLHRSCGCGDYSPLVPGDGTDAEGHTSMAGMATLDTNRWDASPGYIHSFDLPGVAADAVAGGRDVLSWDARSAVIIDASSPL